MLADDYVAERISIPLPEILTKPFSNLIIVFPPYFLLLSPSEWYNVFRKEVC